jgi:ketosteroid isomerase-like protein
MSQENVELVRRAWEATGTEDWPTVVATIHPEAEIFDFDVPDADVYRGHDGFFGWLERWNEGWESWRAEDLELRPIGDDGVIALFRMVARGRHSGLELERLDAIAYRIEDGLIVYMAYFNDQEQALEALAGSGQQADD